jgi:integrase
MAETRCSDNYRRDVIGNLSRLSRFLNNKQFAQMIRDDILSYLNSLKKQQDKDPMHKWIGTYNVVLVHLIRFFKWLYSPNETDRPKPPVIRNIGKLKRLEESTYKPSDLWTLEDDDLFLKYCPSKRLRCYHMVSRDTSCRPHELAGLKIGDIQFRQNGDGTQYAEAFVNGKTGSRHIPLINSIPYVKDYLLEHPQPDNLQAPFLCGKRESKHLSLSRIYNEYQEVKERFKNLAINSDTSAEDKRKISELLRKPWNPYIRRHTAITEKASNAKINAVLEQHAGWKEGSKMKQRYTHYFNNKSNNQILEAFGVLEPDQSQELRLRVKTCPQCNEPNTPDSKFCAKCRFVLRYEGYQEAVEKQRANENKVQELEAKVAKLTKNYDALLDGFKPTSNDDIISYMKKVTDASEAGILKRVKEVEPGMPYLYRAFEVRDKKKLYGTVESKFVPNKDDNEN